MHTLKQKGVVVFDLDGTLVDTSEDLAYTINHLRTQRGLGYLATPDVLKAVGKGAPHLIRQTLALDAEADFNQYIRAFQSHYMSHQGERSAIYPGIEDALKALCKCHSLFVLSNKPHPATVNEIEKHHLTGYFEAVWGAGTFEALKPNPAGIHAALKQADVSAPLGVMVGDLNVDMETGMNAGVHTVFAKWGFGTEPPETSPSAIAISANALPAVIDTLLH